MPATRARRLPSKTKGHIYGPHGPGEKPLNSRIRLAVCAAGIFALAAGSAHADPSPPPSTALRDQMPPLWQRGSTEYFRRWIFSSTIHCDLSVECSPNEADIVATEGGITKAGDGSEVKWRRADSWGDGQSFGEAKKGEIAYAFRNIPRAQAGPVRLSIGSDNGIRVWVNGKLVLARDGRRSLSPDEDQVDVDLQAGDNALLLKLNAQDGFIVRALEAGAVFARPAEISPDVIEMHPALFSVRTDSSPARAGADPVEVEVRRPGGEVKFSAVAKRGELVVVDAKDWPDGPYEVRLVARNHLGLRYVVYRRWYKGNALVQARALAAAAAAADASEPAGFTLRMLAEMVEDRLETKLEDATGNPWPKIHSPLMEYEELMLERAGKVGRVRPGGFVRLAWIDDTDGSPQYCRAYLPWNYDTGRKWPLMLQLHGYNPANPKYVDWWSADNRYALYWEFSGNRSFIYVEPHGRGNTQYSAFGNADVRRCLTEAKRLLSVDEDRVYLTGDSMGGWGTWNVATRNPELFAAIAPVFGGTDYRVATKEENLARLSPLENYLLERDSSWAQAAGLNNLPILVHHGDADGAVNVEWSRWGVRMLQRWGYDVRYHEYPGKVHEQLTWSNPLMNGDWFLEHTRNAHPLHVRVRSAELRNAQAYWVRVEQRARPLEFMHVDAELVDRNLIRLDTGNVAEVTLTPGPLVDAAKPVRVVWNGVERSLEVASSGQLRLSDPAYRPAKLHKTPALPGSFNDFLNTPFALVVGTASKDPRINEICRAQAEQFVQSWEGWQKVRPRLFLDTEISDADIARYSLILIGGPAANRVAATMAAQLPLTIRGDVITIGDANRGKSYRAPGAGVQLLYPNPRNPARYLWITAGTSSGGLARVAPSPYNLVEWDFLIDDGYVPAFKEEAMRERTRLVSGMFDQNWRYDAAYVQAGDADIRARGRQLRMPTGARADAKLVEEIAGRYQLSPGPLLTLDARDEMPVLTLEGDQEKDTLEYIEGMQFYLPRYNAWLWFERDESGRVAAVKVYAGEDLEGKRKDD